MTEAVLEKIVTDLMERPSKRLRAGLVRAGYMLALEVRGPQSDDAMWLERFCEAIEAIHGGSLVVDDIQDGSLERRGAPSLHKVYGTALALNAGNSMYFESLAEWSREPHVASGDPFARELWAYRLYFRALSVAHRGQALDLGMRVHQMPQNDVMAVTRQCLLQKSGALAGLALGWGAVAARQGERSKEFEALGSTYGWLLQLFDDLGNFVSDREPTKRFEDVQGLKPCWLWAIASQRLDATAWADAVGLALRGATAELEQVFARAKVAEHARAQAEQELEVFGAELQKNFPKNEGAMQLMRLADQLRGAYV